MVRTLVKCPRVDVNVRDCDWNTAEKVALVNGNFEVADIIAEEVKGRRESSGCEEGPAKRRKKA